MAPILLKILYCLLLAPQLVVPYPQNTDSLMHARRSYYLQELYKSYSVCIIHIVDLIGNLEPAQPALPIIFDVWTKELESLRNLSGDPVKFNKGIEATAQNRMMGRSTTSKLKYFSCFVTLILARENSFSGSTFSRFSIEVDEPLRIFLRQDFALGWDTPWDKSGVQQRYLSAHPMFFPESVIILCDSNFELSAINSLDGPWEDLDLRLFFPSAAHVPTILLVFMESEHPEKYPSLEKEPCDVSLLFCTHCDPNKTFIQLGCTHPVRRAESEASKYVALVPWLVFDGLYYWEDIITPCPFTLGTPPHELCTAEYVNIQAILFASMNSTISRKSWLTWQQDLRFPGC